MCWRVDWAFLSLARCCILALIAYNEETISRSKWHVSFHIAFGNDPLCLPLLTVFWLIPSLPTLLTNTGAPNYSISTSKCLSVMLGCKQLTLYAFLNVRTSPQNNARRSAWGQILLGQSSQKRLAFSHLSVSILLVSIVLFSIVDTSLIPHLGDYSRQYSNVYSDHHFLS